MHMAVLEENLGRQLFLVSKAHHKLASQTYDRIGLCRGQPPVLFALAEKENMTQNELSEKLEVTAATMTNLLRRMEAAGFITRLRDDQDKRVSRVTLTPFGREKLAQSLQLIEEMDQNAFAGFSAQEQVEADVYLTRIHANLTRCCKMNMSK
jgi:DNA-binding MarR family transcriptional regulator